MIRPFRREGVELSPRDDMMRTAESDDHRATDRFAEMLDVAKLRGRDCDERTERAVRVRRGHGALEGDVNYGHGEEGEGMLHHYSTCLAQSK